MHILIEQEVWSEPLGASILDSLKEQICSASVAHTQIEPIKKIFTPEISRYYYEEDMGRTWGGHEEDMRRT